ncbi:MAG: DUF2637 domain-containing protein [Trebonia sp.]
MNERTRRAALYAIGIIAVLASVDALAHSYTGLYAWALHHRLGGWQAMSWPAEIDVFLVVGELALYVAYLDSWSGRDRIWPWLSAVVGLAVSVAGNVGHIQSLLGVPVTVTDRLTAAASPVAAFAGLMIGFLVLKKVRQQGAAETRVPDQAVTAWPLLPSGAVEWTGANEGEDAAFSANPVSYLDQGLIADAVRIVLEAAASRQPVSQRVLAARLRERGHRFSNAQLRDIVNAAIAGGRRAA